MSTIALQIIELVKSLPAEDQQAVRNALSGQPAVRVAPQRRRLPRLADGSYVNPAGIPNDDPIFQILEQIEDERHFDHVTGLKIENWFEPPGSAVTGTD